MRTVPTLEHRNPMIGLRVLGQLLLKKDHILAKDRKLYVKDHLRSVQDRIFSLRFSTSQDPLDFKKYFLKIVRSFEFVSLRAFE